jgi:hypothetical protein
LDINPDPDRVDQHHAAFFARRTGFFAGAFGAAGAFGGNTWRMMPSQTACVM